MIFNDWRCTCIHLTFDLSEEKIFSKEKKTNVMKTKHEFMMPLNVGFFEAVIRQFVVIWLPWAIVFAHFYFLIPVAFYIEVTIIGRFCPVKYFLRKMLGKSVAVTDPWLKEDLMEMREIEEEHLRKTTNEISNGKKRSE